MSKKGRLFSSNDTELSINFRACRNDEKIQNALRKIQEKPQENSIKKTVNIKIYEENGAPFAYLHTNLRKEPLKLLIDTGAAITILAEDAIKEDIIKTKYTLNLYGIIGKGMSIKTNGMVNGTIALNNQFFGINMHLIDRKYAGPSDGYLGYDFLSSHRTIIDMKKMEIQFDFEKIMQNSNENDKENENDTKENESNFLNILAQHYEFENERYQEKQKRIELMEKGIKYNEYREASIFYENEYEKSRNLKVNANQMKNLLTR